MPTNILSDAGLIGYLPVALPREIKPGQIMIFSKGMLQPLSSDDTLKKLFEQGDEKFYPTMSKEKTLPQKIQGFKHLSTAFKAKVNLVEKFIPNGIGASAGISDSDYIVFEYNEPVMQEVKSIIDLSEYLNDSKVKNSDFAQKLYTDDIYVVTAVLKAKKLSYQIISENDLKAELNLPEIEDVVEGSFNFDRNRFREHKVSNNGDKPLTFALQAIKVRYDRSLLNRLLGEKGVFKVIYQEGLIVRGDDYDEKERIGIETLSNTSRFIL